MCYILLCCGKHCRSSPGARWHELPGVFVWTAASSDRSCCQCADALASPWYWWCAPLLRRSELAFDQCSVGGNNNQAALANRDRVERTFAEQLINLGPTKPAQLAELADRCCNDAIRYRGHPPSSQLTMADVRAVARRCRITRIKRDQMFLVILVRLPRQPWHGTPLSRIGCAGEP